MSTTDEVRAAMAEITRRQERMVRTMERVAGMLTLIVDHIREEAASEKQHKEESST